MAEYPRLPMVGESWLRSAPDDEPGVITLSPVAAGGEPPRTAIEQVMRSLHSYMKAYARKNARWPDVLVVVGHQLWDKMMIEMAHLPWSEMTHRPLHREVLLMAAPGGKQVAVMPGPIELLEWKILLDEKAGGTVA